MTDPVTPESEQHEQNMRDLRLIRDDPGWALTAVQEWRRLAAQLEQAQKALLVAWKYTARAGLSNDQHDELDSIVGIVKAAYDEQSANAPSADATEKP